MRLCVTACDLFMNLFLRMGAECFNCCSLNTFQAIILIYRIFKKKKTNHFNNAPYFIENDYKLPTF